MQTPVNQRVRMKDVLRRGWWLMLLRGLAGIILGVLLFSQSSLTVPLLIVFMAYYWLADGIFMLIAAFIGRQVEEKWWWVLIRAGLSILAALIVLGYAAAVPEPTERPTFLVILLSAQAIIVGLVDLVTGARIRQEVGDEWVIVLGAALSIIFGVLLFFQAAVTIRLLVPVIGIFAIVGGLGMIFFAFRLRKL